MQDAGCRSGPVFYELSFRLHIGHGCPPELTFRLHIPNNISDETVRLFPRRSSRGARR